MEWKPGDKVTADLRLAELVSSGSMGNVWAAFHTLLGRVAVKFMAPELASDMTLQSRFAREARAGAEIRSPYVVSLYDHGVTRSGEPYLLMELFEGETLRERLDRELRLHPIVVARFARELAYALEAMHSKQIVHRDIKPENMAIDRASGFLRVFDFGIAKQPAAADESSLTKANALLGSFAYMSREQLLDPKGAVPAYDVWSAAVVMYEALTGVVPFPAKTFGELLRVLVKGKFARPSELGIAPEYDDVFTRAFAPDPAARFPAASDLADAIADAKARAAG
jgi:serine/threonine protein kinase